MTEFLMDGLRKLALDIKERSIPESEILRTDRTKELLHSMETRIRDGESINININSPVRSGKSTVGMELIEIIYAIMKRYKLTKEVPTIQNIIRDQTEFQKIILNEKTNVAYLIDEYSEIENSGENATIREKLMRTFSDLHAWRNVHRVYCSPTSRPDINSDIQLEIYATDSKNKITRCKLIYILNETGNTSAILLGYVDIDVSNITKNWLKEYKELGGQTLKQAFSNNNEKAMKIINKIKEEDYYIDYIIRKKQKTEMITKEGIIHLNRLENAELIQNIVNNLKGLARIGIVKKGLIDTHVKQQARTLKIPLSILGTRLLNDEITGILDPYRIYSQLANKKKREKGKQEEINKQIITIYKTIVETEKELNQLVKLQKEYQGDPFAKAKASTENGEKK